MYNFSHSFEEEANVGNVERIISGGAGAALLVKGIKGLTSSPIQSGIELALSAYLLFRAVTAYCPVRDAISKEYPLKPKQKQHSFGHNKKQQVS
jgi:uncharacterized membrane protein